MIRRFKRTKVLGELQTFSPDAEEEVFILGLVALISGTAGGSGGLKDDN